MRRFSALSDLAVFMATLLSWRSSNMAWSSWIYIILILSFPSMLFCLSLARSAMDIRRLASSFSFSVCLCSTWTSDLNWISLSTFSRCSWRIFCSRSIFALRKRSDNFFRSSITSFLVRSASALKAAAAAVSRRRCSRSSATERFFFLIISSLDLRTLLMTGLTLTLLLLFVVKL